MTNNILVTIEKAGEDNKVQRINAKQSKFFGLVVSTEKHFRNTEILWETSAFDEKSGQHLSYRLKVPRLLPGVVASQMPNCPDYLPGPSTSRRLSLQERLISKDQSNISKALMQSGDECEKQKKTISA